MKSEHVLRIRVRTGSVLSLLIFDNVQLWFVREYARSDTNTLCLQPILKQFGKKCACVRACVCVFESHERHPLVHASGSDVKQNSLPLHHPLELKEGICYWDNKSVCRIL